MNDYIEDYRIEQNKIKHNLCLNLHKQLPGYKHYENDTKLFCHMTTNDQSLLSTHTLHISCLAHVHVN